MIKATLKDQQTGERILLLGLSHGNVLRLQNDQFIQVTKEQLDGQPFDQVLIFYGDSEAEMVGQLRRAGMLEGVPMHTHNEKDHQP